MTRKTWCFFTVALLAILVSHSHAAILFNEIYANPLGNPDDNREFIELISTTGGVEPMTGIVLLLFDANGGNTGTIADAYNLNSYSTGTNGLLAMGNNYDVPTPGPLAGPWNLQWTNPLQGNQETVLKDPSGANPYSGLGTGDLENGAFAAMLVTGFSGAQGTDLDTNDDGVFDSTPWTTVLDSIAWQEWDATTSAPIGRIYGVPAITQTGFTPDAVARERGNFTPNSPAAWYGGDILTDQTYDLIQNFNLPLGATPTPTYENFPIPEPSTLVLGALGGLALLVIRRRR